MTRTQSVKVLKAITYAGIYGGLLLPLAFFPVVIFPFVFSKLVFFQILIGVTFPAYVILAWIEPQVRPKWVPLYSAIAAYFVALALSVIFAVDPVRAWWGNQERMNGLFTLIHFFLWLTMMVSVVKTWAQWKKLIMYEVGVSVLMAIVALLQKPFPNLLLFPAADRVGGLLDNPIYMAAYQIFNLFFILYLWLKGVSKSTKIWLAMFAVVDFSAFVAAESRGALLGLAAGLFVFAVAYAIMTPSKKAKTAVLGAVAALFVGYGLLFALRNTTFVQNTPWLGRFTNFQTTTATRFIAWNIAWQGFLERPLTGWGLDDFHILFNAKYNPQSLRFGYYETWFDRAHNTVMDTLSMTGIFGTLTFFGIFGALFYSVIRAYRRKWIDIQTASIFFALPVAYFVQNLFVFDQPAGFTMSFFLYALVIRATMPEYLGSTPGQKSAEEKPGTARPVPWIAFGILEAAFVLLVWRTSVLPFRASMITIRSNSYFGAGLYAQSFAYAKQAAAIPTPYLDEQTFLQSRNIISLADNGTLDKVPNWREWHDLVVKITERHLADHPQNTNPHFIYARFLQSFARYVPEDLPKAEQEFLKALETSPKRQQLFFSLGQFYFIQGKKDQGYEMFRQAAAVDPEVGESRWYAGAALFIDLGRKEEGAKEIAAAFKVKAPYDLKNVREAVVAADAYEVLHDVDGYLALLKIVPSLGGGDANSYVELARVAESLGLIPQRDMILNAVIKGDPSSASRFAPLLVTHTAKTIAESLAQTPAPTAAPVQVTPTPSPVTIVATSGPNESGPRK